MRFSEVIQCLGFWLAMYRERERLNLTADKMNEATWEGVIKNEERIRKQQAGTMWTKPCTPGGDVRFSEVIQRLGFWLAMYRERERLNLTADKMNEATWEGVIKNEERIRKQQAGTTEEEYSVILLYIPLWCFQIILVPLFRVGPFNIYFDGCQFSDTSLNLFLMDVNIYFDGCQFSDYFP